MHLDDIDPRILYVLMKGEPGLRKSTQALGFPGPQYWFSWDRKMQGISLPNKLWNMPKNHVTFDDYADWESARIKLETFVTNCPYKTLVFDSLTTMGDLVLRQSMKAASKPNKIGTIQISSIEDFNAETSAFNQLLGLTKDINVNQKVNIILIAHVMEVTNKALNGETTTTRTIVTAGKRVAAKVPALCTEVWNFKLKKGMMVGGKGEYAITTSTNEHDFARTSIGLADEIVFNDKSLYEIAVEPAIKRLLGET